MSLQILNLNLDTSFLSNLSLRLNFSDYYLIFLINWLIPLFYTNIIQLGYFFVIILNFEAWVSTQTLPVFYLIHCFVSKNSIITTFIWSFWLGFD